MITLQMCFIIHNCAYTHLAKKLVKCLAFELSEIKTYENQVNEFIILLVINTVKENNSF
jgi:hypothetical protein